MAKKSDYEKQKQEEKRQRRREKIIGPDSKTIDILNKIGSIIILNIIWIVTCLPVFTIGTATTSFYYAMIKSVRRERSYPVKEYFQSFKRVFGKGSLITVVILALLFILDYLRNNALATGTDTGTMLSRIYIAIMFFIFGFVIYIFPVLSRFEMKISNLVKLAFVMEFRFIGYTFLILAGTAAIVFLLIYIVPIPLILVIPGAWCYVCTFMIEKALRKYMPAPKEGESDWYYE